MWSAFTFGKDTFDPDHRFETSWLLPPWALFACRALLTLFIFTTRFFIIGWWYTHDDLGGPEAVRNSFAYFTNLTFWGLAFYFLFSSIHTFTYARTGVPLLARFPRPLQALHSLYYTTITVYPLLVVIVYWSILYEGTWFEQEADAYSNVAQHLLSGVFALFEIVVPRTATPPWIHILWIVLILALYLALAYLVHYTQGFYPYSFLDPQENGSGVVAGYIFGIAAGGIVLYLVVRSLIWLRHWVTEEKLGFSGKFARVGRRVEIEDGLETKEAPPMSRLS